MSGSLNSKISVAQCKNVDIPLAASFVGTYWFDPEVVISTRQQEEFIRLELDDLSRRYGERVGKRKYPASLLLAKENDEIIGYI